MKMVLAFVQPFKLDEVTHRLQHIDRFPGMTVTAARGFGRERAEEPSAEADQHVDDFETKVRIETVVHDEQVDEVVELICRTAHTGRYGDGMVFVLPVERAVRIKTLHEGEGEV
jgi:nitrogen regulatory protein P-II 1